MSQTLFVDHIFFVVLGILFPVAAVFRSKPLLRAVEEWSTSMKLDFYRSNSVLMWISAGIVVGVWYVTGRPPTMLGLQMPQPGAWPATLFISGLFLVAYGIDAWQEVAAPQARQKTREYWRKNVPFLPENKRELQGFHWLALGAAVGEEILFRGFLITYFIGVLGTQTTDKMLALIIPTLIFSLAHYYQGWKAVGKICVLSLAFGTIFLISASLLIPILLHLLVDVIGGWLGYWVLREKQTGL